MRLIWDTPFATSIVKRELLHFQKRGSRGAWNGRGVWERKAGAYRRTLPWSNAQRQKDFKKEVVVSIVK